MARVKLVIIFPNPSDPRTLDQALISQTFLTLWAGLYGNMDGKLTRVLGAPNGLPPFFRIMEVYFPSREKLEAWLASREAQAVAAETIAISSGGTPTFLVCDEAMLPLG